MSKSYKNKSFCVIGRHGFIGKALSKKITSLGGKVTSFPTKKSSAVFNFSGPTHLQFEQSMDFFLRESINQFLFLARYCKYNKIPLIWPSSALVLEEKKDTPYSHAKKILEEIQLAYNSNILCLRIFPVFGVGEENKGDYKTFIYKCCEDMVAGKQPVVYGDGKQTRDLLYIDDLVDNILLFYEQKKKGIISVGAGKSTSFNQVIAIINKVLKTNIKPVYVDKPAGYSKGIKCKTPIKTKYSIEDGVKLIIKDLKKRSK